VSDSQPPDGRLVGRRIVLGVSGGIAAYKAVELCRRLVDEGAHVAPVLTTDALHFVGATTFSALASEPVRMSLFDADEPIPHTRLGQTADLVVVAPATAKLLGKYAAGISDDLLSATLLATRAPVLVCPAMHTEMWEHPAVQENLATLRRRGVHVVDPEEGRLAGGDVGAGRLAASAVIVEAIVGILQAAGTGSGSGPADSGPACRRSDLVGMTVLVTSGGTREAIDPVRFIGNRSSGKMGHALAQVAVARGARVTLVSTVDRPTPPGCEVVRVESAQEMHDAVMARSTHADVVVMAAAVADFRPRVVAGQKIKKAAGPPEIVLEPTPDILAALGATKRPGQVLVGFAAETTDVRAHALEKMRRKNVDLMVANDVSAPDAGFEVDTNRAVLLEPTGRADETSLMSKVELADRIYDLVVAARARSLVSEPSPSVIVPAIEPAKTDPPDTRR
jgi:phosphopantothenoylcysteine decarboxylase / phosphopantothenate---cysteine ligase